MKTSVFECVHLDVSRQLTQIKYWLLKKIKIKSNLVDDTM